MSLSCHFIPAKPFPSFKWKWASLQCTEGLNDPVVLLGVLFRIRKLELLKRRITYSSSEFADEMADLQADIKDSGIGVALATRTGERNLMRNSGQYWRALGLIPPSSRGVIQLTDFGRKVADHIISQSEFAAITIRRFALPNPAIQPEDECALWKRHGIKLHPLRLLLQILKNLSGTANEGYLTKEELLQIVIPLSGNKGTTVADYTNFIRWHRQGQVNLLRWPDCAPESNDHRIAREFLLFLANYGYVERQENSSTGKEIFLYNALLDEEITEIITMPKGSSFDELLGRLQGSDVTSEIERKRVQQTRSRPNQARFRKEILSSYHRCVITNVAMSEVLEAAHIVPFKYNGEDNIANGLCMRMDIHQLYDSGHLRIAPDGVVNLSSRARMEYGASIPPSIIIPRFVNKAFVRWRWENYNGL